MVTTRLPTRVRMGAAFAEAARATPRPFERRGEFTQPTQYRRGAGAGTTSVITPILPGGVTLRAIDGGPTYYAANGFTYAADAGFDSPSFFPTALFLERMDNATDLATWEDLGLNVMMTLQANSPGMLTIRADPGSVWVVPQHSELAQVLTTNDGLGPETVGIYAVDEPTTTAACYAPISSTANTYQDNRFWVITFLHTAIDFGDVEGTPVHTIMDNLVTTPGGALRHLHLAATDHYFCAGAHYASIRSQVSGKFGLGAGYALPEISEAQCRRPCRYGDYVRFIRAGNPNSGTAPTWATDAPVSTWIETGGPYTENTDPAYVIKPAEINAAVWSTIINGARMLLYFSLGEGTVGDSLITGTFWKTPLAGETVSNYTQIKNTNALVRQLASVINSPFAVGYVSVTPAAQYLSGSPALDDAGIDVMAKYHNASGGDNKFYVFAMPRVATATNVAATFSVVGGGSVATVINEARTVPISGGQFSDTFATGNTVHIYRIDP